MESRIHVIPYIWNLACMDQQFLNLKDIEELPSNPAGRTSVFYELKISHKWINLAYMDPGYSIYTGFLCIVFTGIRNLFKYGNRSILLTFSYIYSIYEIFLYSAPSNRRYLILIISVMKRSGFVLIFVILCFEIHVNSEGKNITK